MKDIAIYGAGGFGREVACLIKRINEETPRWNIIGFFDDGKEPGFNTEYGEVLGNADTLNVWNKPLDVVIAIGKPVNVRSVVEKITNPLIEFPNVIAKDTNFLDRSNCTIGKGNIISSGCLVSCNTKIGDFNSLNDFVSIGHDTTIGSFNSFMTATRISGIVTIGDCNFFGVNSCTVQGVKIGNNTSIAAGSAIMRRTKDGYTYIGIPASPLVIK